MPKFLKIVVYTLSGFFIAYLTHFHWLTYLTSSFLIGLFICETQTLLEIIGIQNNLLNKQNKECSKFSQTHKKALIEAYKEDYKNK